MCKVTCNGNGHNRSKPLQPHYPILQVWMPCTCAICQRMVVDCDLDCVTKCTKYPCPVLYVATLLRCVCVHRCVCYSLKLCKFAIHGTYKSSDGSQLHVYGTRHNDSYCMQLLSAVAHRVGEGECRRMAVTSTLCQNWYAHLCVWSMFGHFVCTFGTICGYSVHVQSREDMRALPNS